MQFDNLKVRSHYSLNLDNPACSAGSNCYLLPLSVSSVELLSFGLALNHWIHGLQVGGVRHERQHDVLVRLAVDPLVKHPKVVFDIAGTLQVEEKGGERGVKCHWNHCTVRMPSCIKLTSSAASNLGSN